MHNKATPKIHKKDVGLLQFKAGFDIVIGLKGLVALPGL